MALRVLVSKTTNFGKNTLVVTNASSQIYLQNRSIWGQKKEKKPKIIYQTPSGKQNSIEQVYRSKLPFRQEYEYAWLREANPAPKGVKNGAAFFSADAITTIHFTGKVTSRMNNIKRT